MSFFFFKRLPIVFVAISLHLFLHPASNTIVYLICVTFYQVPFKVSCSAYLCSIRDGGWDQICWSLDWLWSSRETNTSANVAVLRVIIKIVARIFAFCLPFAEVRPVFVLMDVWQVDGAGQQNRVGWLHLVVRVMARDKVFFASERVWSHVVWFLCSWLNVTLLGIGLKGLSLMRFEFIHPKEINDFLVDHFI